MPHATKVGTLSHTAVRPPVRLSVCAMPLSEKGAFRAMVCQRSTTTGTPMVEVERCGVAKSSVWPTKLSRYLENQAR